MPWHQDLFYLENFPWVKWHLDKKEGWAGEAEQRSKEDTDSGEEAEEYRKAITEEEAAAVFSSLEKKRQEWADLLPRPADHFKVCVRGGQSNVRKLGVQYDASMATYRTQEAEEFCQCYRTGRQKSYQFSKYGEEAAMYLAQYWAERMEYFLAISLDSGLLFKY
eukprot:4606566-Lingulodinium_polyedra.AAC.1